MNSFVPTFLYIKQHTITGKLYLGKTVKNPEKYLGSGVYWKRHINKHGKEFVINLWYCLFYDAESISKMASLLSEICGIVNSGEWLNVIPETGVDNSYLNDITWLSKKSKDYYQNLTDLEKTERISKIKIGISTKMTIEQKEARNLKLIEFNKSFKGKSKGLGRKTDKRKLYESDPNKCLYCNNELSFTKRNNKFCSNSCANIDIGRRTKAVGGFSNQKEAVSKAWKGVSRGKQTEKHKENIRLAKLKNFRQ